MMSGSSSNDFTVTDGTNSGPAVFMFVRRPGRSPDPAAGTPGGPFNISLFAEPATGRPTGPTTGAGHRQRQGHFSLRRRLPQRQGRRDRRRSTRRTWPAVHRPPPSRGTPYNIQNIAATCILPTPQDAAGTPTPGKEQGVRGRFDTSGHLPIAWRRRRSARWGWPWPRWFRLVRRDLLVGNARTATQRLRPRHNFAFRGQPARPRQADHHLGLACGGNGVSSGDTNAVYFTARSEPRDAQAFGC